MKSQKTICGLMSGLLAFGIIATGTAQAQSHGITVPGLIHLWSGEGNADDSAGSAHGTLGGTTAFGLAENGQQAFDFDGLQSSVVSLPVDINPGVLPQITMGMLVNMRSQANNRGWVIGHDDSGFDRSINLTDIRYGYGVAGGTGVTPHASTLLRPKDNLDSWHCVAVAYDADNATATFYADGATQTVFASPASGRVTATLGGLTTQWLNHTVDALVDEVFMFNRALGADEITQVCAEALTIEVTIDIKPDSDPNSINLCSGGAVPLAVLGSDALDVSMIDTETLRFAGSSVKVVGKKDPRSLCSFDDVDLDGHTDLVCHFLTTDIAALDGDSISAQMSGNLLDSTPILGSDSVNIVKDTCS